MHLQAVIERVWKCTWRPWSSEFDDALGRHHQARVEEYLEAVNRRHTGCWHSIHPLVNSQPWECDEVTLPLSSHGGMAVAVDHFGRHAKHWSYILWSTPNRGNVRKNDDPGWMLYSVYQCVLVLGVCCTWCVLYLVYVGLRVRCTWCKLYWV